MAERPVRCVRGAGEDHEAEISRGTGRNPCSRYSPSSSSIHPPISLCPPLKSAAIPPPPSPPARSKQVSAARASPRPARRRQNGGRGGRAGGRRGAARRGPQIRGTLFLPRSALSPWCTHADLEGCALAGGGRERGRRTGGWGVRGAGRGARMRTECVRGIKGCEASIAEQVQGLIGSGNDWSMRLTEGLVRTSRAPCLSCAAGGLERREETREQ